MKNDLFNEFRKMELEIIEKLNGGILDVSPMNDYLFDIDKRHMSEMYVTENNSIFITSIVSRPNMSLIGFGIFDIENIYKYVMLNQLPPF